jgi:hypothetical protein
MQLRFRPWHLAALMVVFCLGIVTVLTLLRVRSNSSAADLVARLPRGEATVVYIDASALQEAGLLDLLAGAGVTEETDYQEFVAESGFDYTRDLDSVLASFYESDTFLLVRGRFDWGRLVGYVESRNGNCHNGFCRMKGNLPDRNISFFAVTPFVLGMAVSVDDWAALVLHSVQRESPLAQVPEQPVWVTLSGPMLSRSDWLPSGARSFASAMSEAERVTLALSPSGTDFEARLSVDCRTPAQAARLAARLEQVTELLRSLIRREKKAPNPKDLSGVLTAGSFYSQDRQVQGRWPIQKEFLEAVAAGSE